MSVGVEPERRMLRPDALVSAATRNARRRRAAHRCAQCNASLDGPHWKCEKCRTVAAEKARERRRLRSPERIEADKKADRLRGQAFRQRRVDRGLCPKCGVPVKKRGSVCTRCRDYLRRLAESKSPEAKAARRERARLYEIERWSFARSRGLCGEYGKRAPVAGGSRCGECRAAAWERFKKRRAKSLVSANVVEPALEAVSA